MLSGETGESQSWPNGSYHSVYDSGKEKRKKGKIFFFKKGYRLKEYREAGKGYKKTNQDKISAGSCVYAAGCHLQQSGNQQDQGVFSSEERKNSHNGLKNKEHTRWLTACPESRFAPIAPKPQRKEAAFFSFSFLDQYSVPVQKSQPKTDQNSRNPLTAQQKKTCIKISISPVPTAVIRKDGPAFTQKAKQVNSRFGVDLFLLQQRGGHFCPDGISPINPINTVQAVQAGRWKKRRMTGPRIFCRLSAARLSPKIPDKTIKGNREGINTTAQDFSPSRTPLRTGSEQISNRTPPTKAEGQIGG